jgi:hypothetical protein
MGSLRAIDAFRAERQENGAGGDFVNSGLSDSWRRSAPRRGASSIDITRRERET